MSLSAATDFKELVRARTDIVQLIGESITLHPERGGRTFKALCPFHDDHNPSLTVNPERQTYKCWSCGEGGDCFSFVMKYEGISFREALEQLAGRAGVEIPSFAGSREDGAVTKQPLYEVLAWAEQEFHKYLVQAAAAQRGRDYLRSRNFRDETIGRFLIGFHPDDWQWVLNRARSRFSNEVLQAAGLIAPQAERAGFYDKFVDRVMFPIRDERGRCVAFGARLLPDSQHQKGGKYINSDESPVFHKSRLVYGLDKARDAIRKTGTAVVMEGYVDCIKAHQAGVVNAVAILGTSLTETHVTILKRLAHRVVLVYDGDEAGQRGAARAIEKFLAQDVDIRILTLPDELDPDEYLDAHGVESFEQLLEQAPEAWEFRYRNCVSQNGVGTSASRLRVLEDMLALLSVSVGMAGSVKEKDLVGQLASRLSIPQRDVLDRLRQVRAGRGMQGGGVGTAAARKVPAGEPHETSAGSDRAAMVLSLQRHPPKDDLLECEILQVLFTDPPKIRVVRQEIGIDDVRHPLVRELLAVCYDLDDHGELPVLGRVLAAVECPHLKRLAVWIDEEAAAHGVAQKLAATVDHATPDASTADASAFLRQVIDGVTWRRKRASHETAKGRLAERLDPTTSLDPELRELLQQSASFHQQRAAKKLLP